MDTSRPTHKAYVVFSFFVMVRSICSRCGFVWIVKSPDERNPPPPLSQQQLSLDLSLILVIHLPGAVAGKIELASERHEEALE